MLQGGMPLNIKNIAVERLVAEVAALTGETKTEAVRKALQERRARLGLRAAADRGARLARFLRQEVWPHLPAEERGRRLTKAEEEELLGYGPDGA